MLLLSLSYFIHLLGTVIWLGGLAFLAIVAAPALRQRALTLAQWLGWQKRLTPWIQGSLLVLLISGFVQMTNDGHYAGFLVLDGVWAWAMLLKHIAFVVLVGVTGYQQWWVWPEMERLALLATKRPNLAAEEEAKLQEQELRLLWLNLVCAGLVLLFTAVATAV